MACETRKSPTDAAVSPPVVDTLASAFEPHFRIGVALNRNQIFQENTSEAELITSHFNSIVAENCMKWESLHPEESRFYWTDADAFVAVGERYKMQTIGHTLAWHSQTPAWLFVDAQGEKVSREVLLQRMQHHITTVMQRYRGKVDGWDVVNEAIVDDGSLRQNKFLEIIGPDWVEHMYRFAQAADPQARLHYNDYGMWIPEKREGVYRLVKGLQEKGIRVDAIGMQGHIGLEVPTVAQFEKSLVRFAELGDVMITELDITVLPRPSDDVSAEVSRTAEYKEALNPFSKGLPIRVSTRLDDRFVEMFQLFMRHKNKISRVTTWGVTDRSSWRNDWPIKGRVDYPLLFRRDGTPKQAVERLINLGRRLKR
ncbi:MAG: endo-1,4-beta-xylanase [Myxococcales bacterium]|nr:endo-1,4-beta-xylanase [Myxococcales bacterium]